MSHHELKCEIVKQDITVETQFNLRKEHERNEIYKEENEKMLEILRKEKKELEELYRENMKRGLTDSNFIARKCMFDTYTTRNEIILRKIYIEGGKVFYL
jgi:hypothetical protein